MAGKRQHFIPQFLQRGFSSHTDGDEVFTWVYRKDKKPFISNIKNVGVEKFFYSEDDDPCLDDAITVAEGDFAQLVDSIRINNAVDKKEFQKIAVLISHLEFRTRHLRQNFLTTSNNLLNRMLEFLNDPASCESFLRKKVISDPSVLETCLSNELSKGGLPQDILPVLMQQSAPLIERLMPVMVKNMSRILAYLKEEMPTRLKQASKDGHIKALNRGIAPDVKVNILEKLKFRIDNSAENHLLLGDSAVLFHVSGDRSYKTFLEKDDRLIAVYLPISKRQVLVGSIEDTATNFMELRRTIAGCSLEYFIASESNPENERLSKVISKKAPILTTSQIEVMIENIMSE